MITVLGAGGFIGAHLVRHLENLGIAHQAPARDEPLTGRALGRVIYCIGLTADFRDRPIATVDAHVGRLSELIATCAFESILYLSSTRLYLRSLSAAHEDDGLVFHPAQADDLYGLSKAAGEALVLSLGARGRVARLANVYGPGQANTFLASLLSEAQQGGTLTLETALDSQKDYVSIDDVVELLVRIAGEGRHRIYNVASGTPVTNRDLVRVIGKLTGCVVEVSPAAPTMIFPPINIERIRAEFDFVPRSLLDDLPGLIGTDHDH